MFGWFKSADEKALELVLKGCEAEEGTVQGVDGVFRRRHGAILRDVVRELRKGERVRFNPAEILALIGAILALIQQLGDLVAEIVDRIRERKAKQ